MKIQRKRAALLACNEPQPCENHSVRIRSIVVASVLALGITCAGTAHAGPPPPHGLELGARLLFGVGNYGTAAMAGGQIGGRLVPHLSLGAYADVTAFYVRKDRCFGCGEFSRPLVRFGGFGDIHLVPHGTVDPYFRLALGATNANRTYFEFEGDFGLDIRFRRWAVGPFFAMIRPLDGDAPWWFGLGGRAVIAF